MKHITLAIVALLIMIQSNAQQDIADKFEKGMHSHHGVTLPYLLPWVFSKTLRRENSLDIHTLEMDADSIILKWHNSYPEDSVELWFSHDKGTHWDLIASGLVDSMYAVSKYDLPDCFAGIFRIIAKDSAQWFYSTYTFSNSNGYDPNGFNERQTAAAVYPNPASEKTNIVPPNFDHVEVYNMNGTLLHVSSEKELDLSGYSTGLYILQLYDRKGLSSPQKLIVQ